MVKNKSCTQETINQFKWHVLCLIMLTVAISCTTEDSDDLSKDTESNFANKSSVNKIESESPTPVPVIPTSIPTNTPVPNTPVPATLAPDTKGKSVNEKPSINLFDAIGQQDLDSLKQHMDYGTDINKLFIPEGYPFPGASPLHLAILTGNEEIVRLLIDSGAEKEIQAKNQEGGTPLHWAAFFGIKNMVEFLVEIGSDINAIDNGGCTPTCASSINNPFADQNNETFKANRLLIKQFLIEKGGKVDSGVTGKVSGSKSGVKPPQISVFDAVGMENITVVKQHMDYGTDPNSFVPEGFPLAGASTLHIATLTDNTDVIKILVDGGVDIDIKAKDDFGGTPLQWAAFWGKPKAANILIDLGADIDAVDGNGCSPKCYLTIPNDLLQEEYQAPMKEGRKIILGLLNDSGAK